MYIILEYLMYVALVSVLAASLLAASTMLLIVQEGAKRLAEGSRKMTSHVVQMGARVINAGKALEPHDPHPSE